MQDLVEVVVSRLKVKTQLSRLRLVQFVAGLPRARESVSIKQKEDGEEDQRQDLHGGEGVEPGDQLGSPLPVHWQKAQSAQGLCQVLRNPQLKSCCNTTSDLPSVQRASHPWT